MESRLRDKEERLQMKEVRLQRKEDAMEDLQRENEDQKVLIDELMKANCGHSWRKASDTE
jgi:hypothetical protein